MLNRWIGIACVLGMLSANTALFMREILPKWLAGDPPIAHAVSLGPNKSHAIQVAVFNEDGVRLGTSWTKSRRTGDIVVVESHTILVSPLLPGSAPNRRMQVHTSLNYEHGSSRVRELRLRVYGMGPMIEIHGEFIPPDDFPCEWRFGDQHGNFVLDADATRALGDVIRPFDRLPGLFVGRAWRVELFDPLAQFLSAAPPDEVSTKTVLVRVTSQETIRHRGRDVETYVVAAPQARAWVTPDGRVLRQVVELPLLGTLRLEHEPFDNEMFLRVVRRHGEP